MCLAVPAKIVSVKDNVAKCQVGDSDTFIEASLMLMDDPAGVEDYIIIHAGFALRKLDIKEAEESIQIFRDMMKMMGEEGTDPRELDGP